MELVYLCNKVDFDKEIEINLSEEFNIEIKNLTLVIEDKQIRIPSFYDSRISNITVFVGRNGTGKTTNICGPIMSPNWLTYRFLVFKKDNELLIFSHPKNIYSIDNKSRFKHKLIQTTDLEPGDRNVELDSKSNEDLKNVFQLYYSTSFTDSSVITRSMYGDISSNGLITFEQLLDKKEFEDALVAFQFKEMSRQLSFLRSDIGQQFEQLISVNPEIIVRNRTMKVRNMENLLLKIDVFKELKKHLEASEDQGSIDISALPGTPRIICIIWAYLCAHDLNNLLSDFLEFLDKNEHDFYSDNLILDDEFVNLNAFIGILTDILNNNITDIKNHQMQLDESLDISLQNTSFRVPIEIAPSIIDFYKKGLRNKITKYNFVWNISSGEYSFLSLFSRLFDVMYRAESRNILLVIDEGDANFHPEWSRQYINILVNWLPKILSRAKSIQLVLTTHSPYVLSDLPTSNIYTLKREKGELIIEHPNKSTFGANINELLADSFFFENSLIGEFAKEKIQLAINNIRSDTDFKPLIALEKTQIKGVINLIGEPFLKEKLTQMYYSKYPEEYNLEKEIEETERKLKKLNRELHDRDSQE